MDGSPAKAVREIDPLDERAGLGSAEVASVEGLPAEIGFADDVVIDDGDLERPGGDRA